MLQAERGWDMGGEAEQIIVKNATLMMYDLIASHNGGSHG